MPETNRNPVLDHPVLRAVKAQFPDRKLRASEYRGQATLIVEPADLLAVMRFLRDDPRCAFDFLSDVFGVDYLNYPSETIGRFAVVYNLCSYPRADRLFVKTFVNPSRPTTGIDADPALEVDSVCEIWPGAEWNERETFDMFGIRFRNHPDMRRILLWESYPGHPLRKDYPVRGRGEREHFKVVGRTDA
ncbi:MAG TPA: NADH-quinone oxidoreductase subunit C [Phycisphaerales bacterium]|nr:NADH-quinone oxidoreductase subunit C [Phycisphaerales bacterium]